jgi:hypothetical protein
VQIVESSPKVQTYVTINSNLLVSRRVTNLPSLTSQVSFLDSVRNGNCKAFPLLAGLNGKHIFGMVIWEA